LEKTQGCGFINLPVDKRSTILLLSFINTLTVCAVLGSRVLKAPRLINAGRKNGERELWISMGILFANNWVWRLLSHDKAYKIIVAVS
jgi:hypothetical protein